MSEFDRHIREAIFDFLIKLARKKQTTTYEAIAIEFGLPSSGNQLGSVLSPILGDIYRFCANRNLPPLTALVVRKSGQSEGIPGKGFWDLYFQDLKKEKETIEEIPIHSLEEIAGYQDLAKTLENFDFESFGKLAMKALTKKLHESIYNYWDFNQSPKDKNPNGVWSYVEVASPVVHGMLS